MDLASLIRNVPDFPKPGIQFKDVTTLLKNGPAFRDIIDGWKTRYANKGVTAIVGAEARGFIFGSALAYAMGLPFIPVRKKGKLPAKTLAQEFDLEYGTDRIEIHVDAVGPRDRVVLVDDLLATGGTMGAMAQLVRKLGAEIVEVAFVVELPFLKGREKLSGLPVYSLVSFEGE
jgi:adenine phosphoribosyltransferase